MALVVVTFSSGCISFAFEQPVQEPCSAVDDRSVREAIGRGRDAQRRRRGNDGEIRARAVLTNIVDVIEALWRSVNGKVCLGARGSN